MAAPARWSRLWPRSWGRACAGRRQPRLGRRGARASSRLDQHELVSQGLDASARSVPVTLPGRRPATLAADERGRWPDRWCAASSQDHGDDVDRRTGPAAPVGGRAGVGAVAGEPALPGRRAVAGRAVAPGRPGRPGPVHLPGRRRSVLALVSSATVGAVVAARRPAHPVGWLLLGIALSLTGTAATAQYFVYGLLVRPGALPAARYAVLYQPATVFTTLTLIGFVLLLTPTGALPSPRWRWLAWVMAVTPVVLVLVVSLVGGPVDPRYQALGGPFDLRGLGGVLVAANRAALAVTVVGLVAAAVSLVGRFRHARGVERLQLRWVALAAVLVGLGAVGVLLSLVVGGTAAGILFGLGVGCCLVIHRWPPGRRCCATGCTTWTGSSAAPWPTGCSPWSWAGATPPPPWSSARFWAGTRAWPLPGPPWPWRRCSSRPAAGSKPWWISGSTGDATTPPGSSRGSGPVCATKSTSTPSPLTCWPWSTRPSSRPRHRCGYGHRQNRHAHPQALWPRDDTVEPNGAPRWIDITNTICRSYFASAASERRSPHCVALPARERYDRNGAVWTSPREVDTGAMRPWSTVAG